MNPLDTKTSLTDVTSKVSNISAETNGVNELVKKVTDAFAEKKLFNEVDNIITQLKETKGKSDSLKIGNSSYRMLLTTETQTISIIPPEENMSPADTAKYLKDIIEVLENYKEKKQHKSSDVLEEKYKNALNELFTEKDITTESQQEQLREKIEEQTTITIEFGIINSKKFIKNVTGQYQDTENNLFKYTSTFNKEELANIEIQRKNNLNVNYLGFRPQTDDNESTIKQLENTLQQILDEVKSVQASVNQQDIEILPDQSNIITTANTQKDQLSELLKDSSQLTDGAVDKIKYQIDALHQMWLEKLKDIEKIEADRVVSVAKGQLDTVNDLVQQGAEHVRTARESGNEQDINKAMSFLTDQSLENAIKQMDAQKNQLLKLCKENISEQLEHALKNIIDQIDALDQIRSQEMEKLTQIQNDLINKLQ